MIRSIDRRMFVAVVLILTLSITIAGASNLHLVSEHTTSDDFESEAVTFENMTIFNDRVEADKTGERTATRVDDTDSTSQGDTRGLIIQPERKTHTLELVVSSQTSDISNVEVTNRDTGVVVKSKNISAESGDIITLDITLEAGSEYAVEATANDFGFNSDDDIIDSDEHIKILGGALDGGTSPGLAVWTDVTIKSTVKQNFEYVGVHEDFDADASQVNVTLVNGTVTYKTQYYDGSSWETIEKSEITETGTENHDWVDKKDNIRIVLKGDESVDTFEIESEAILFESSDPEIHDGSASPSGGELVTETPVELSINVSDPDFDTSQGDEVTVTFYDDSDDSVIGTDTLTSNGTATTSWSSPGLGDVSWYAVAEDSYGGETTSQTFHFQTPSEIEIRNESDPEQLVSGEDAEVTVTFFGGEEVHERTTTDGTVDMSGLPDEQFVVQVNIDGFHTRQAIIDSITEQHEVYVLPESADSVTVRFRLNDQTGQFRESDSTLFVEKPITRDGETIYRVVVADEFGQGGYTTALEQDQRYRLRVRNADGREQIVGAYSATQTETVTIEIDELEFSFDAEDMDYRWGAFYNDEQQRVEFSWETLEGVTDYVNIKIYERGNESREVLSESMTEPTAFSISEPVSDELANSTFIVEWDALHNGEEISGSHIIGQSQMPIDLEGVPDNVKHLVAVFGIFVVAGLFSVANVTVGAAVVTIFSGFMWFIGWLPGEVTGILIGVALLLVGVYKVANRGVIR